MLHRKKEGVDGAALPDGVAVIGQRCGVPPRCWEYAIHEKRHEAVVGRALRVEGHGVLVVGVEAVELRHRTREEEVGLVLAGRLQPHKGLRGVGGGALLRGLRAHGSVALVVLVVSLVVVPLVVIVVDVRR
jgi:hypothetical protein